MYVVKRRCNRMVSLSANNFTATGMAICMMGTVPSSIPVEIDLSKQYSYVYDCSKKKDIANVSKTVFNKCAAEKIVDIAMLMNLKKIGSIACFQNDWDGNDASPFTHDAIELFRYVIKNLNKQPEIAPTAANSLLLQYSLKDGGMLYYNLSLDRTERVYLPRGDILQAEEKIFSNEEDLIAIINDDVEKIYGSRKN